MLVCRHCGWENPDEAAFCTNCGRGLVRGRVIESPESMSGGRFRALGSPVVTVKASDPPPAAEPPMPRLRAPAHAASTPTLLDFRMPEQMLAEFSRMRTSVKPTAERREADSAAATTPIRPISVAPPSHAPPGADIVSERPSQMRLPASTPPAPRSALGDIARALRAEDPLSAPSPADTGELVSQPPPAGITPAPGSAPPMTAERPEGPPFEPPLSEPPVTFGAPIAAESPKTIDEVMQSADDVLILDPQTIDPGEVLPDEPSNAPVPLLPAEEIPGHDQVHLLTQRRVTTNPPPGLYADLPMEELPFFESSDDFSNPPSALTPAGDDPDLPFVLGPELEIRPGRLDAEPPGESVDLLPPDGSVDFESDFDDGPAATLPGLAQVGAPQALAADKDADEDAEEDADEDVDEDADDFAGIIEPIDVVDDIQVAPADEEPLDAADVDLVIEEVDDDGVLDSGDMEAVILTTQTEQSAVRAAPPPMPAAASARFVLRPLSENLDDSFVVGVGDEPIDIGRLAGDICFEGDAYLSPLHARFEMIDDALNVTDLDSANGVWLRVRGEAEIEAGSVFICGQQVIRLDARKRALSVGPADGTLRVGAASSGSGFSLAVLDVDGQIATQYRVPAAGCRLGRQLADVVFTDDGFMSSTHALVRPRQSVALLRDLDSRNGVWLRLDGPHALEIGDAIMLGRTVLRVGQPSG